MNIHTDGRSPGTLLMVSSDGDLVQQALVAVYLSVSNFKEINIEFLQVMATPRGALCWKKEPDTGYI